LGENREWVVPVLESLKKLLQAYREAAPEDMKQRDLDLRSLLGDEKSVRALDRELMAGRWQEGLLHDRILVAREVELCEKFGYSRREVMSYVRRARAAAASGKPHPEIENTIQLVEQLKSLCDQTTHGLSEPLPWLKRWRKERKIRSMAEERLFGIGALIADAAQRTNFDLSYSLAAMTLRQDDT
jgi:hypothetical protein